MTVIEYTPGISVASSTPVAVLLGLFDGVHLGHRDLIERTLKVSKREGLTPAVFTFGEGTGLKAAAKRIYPEGEKMRLFESLGIEIVFRANFSAVRDISAEDFVKNILIGSLGARALIAGEDFRFGKGAAGDAAMLSDIGKDEGIYVEIAPMDSFIDGSGKRREISSTVIRELLEAGRVGEAGYLLGEPYHIIGEVEKGRGVGRTLGYPTVNISLQNPSPLASGVYETRLKIGENLYTGLTNVGTCPTFEPREKHTETYLLDYDGDVYSEYVRIDFIRRVRDERRFESVEELSAEIARNVEDVLGKR